LIELPVSRLRPDAILPGQAYDGDAGFDLASCEHVEIAPGERAVVGTGLAVAIPEGCAGLVLPRSGLAARHGLGKVNSPGLIDAGYRGEVICAVVNLDRSESVKVARGDRIAQLVIVELPEVRPAWVDELPPSTRGEGGFGSTGTS
jgi:dUTP pyrophosphatase